MMEKLRKNITFLRLAPVLLVVLSTLVGVALGKTWGNLVLKLVACLLMACAFALRYLVDRKVGLYAEIALIALYAVAAFPLSLASPLNAAIFAVGALAIDHLIGIVFRQSDAMHRETAFERERLRQISTVDESTQLRNVRAYLNDAMIVIRFTRRYQLYLGLILWRLDNTDALRKTLGREEFSQYIREIAEKLRVSIRFEDMIFVFEDKQSRLTVGTLHVANTPEVCAVVEQRIRGVLSAFGEAAGHPLVFSTSAARLDQIGADSPLALLEKAKAGAEE